MILLKLLFLLNIVERIIEFDTSCHCILSFNYCLQGYIYELEITLPYSQQKYLPL